VIRVEHDSHSWEDTVHIAPGYVIDLPVIELTNPGMSNVTFASDPAGANVQLVRGDTRRSLGQTPITRDVETGLGSWTAEFSKEGFRTNSAQVDSRTTQLTVTLQPIAGSKPKRSSHRSSHRESDDIDEDVPAADEDEGSSSAAPSGSMGVLSINTVPWSQVFVDGRLVGNTPQRNIELSAGSHRLTLVNESFNIREVVQVNIQAGKTLKKVLTLKPSGE